MIQQYCPDPDDDDLVFNLPTSDIIQNYDQLINHQDTTTVESDSDEGPTNVPFTDSKNLALSILKAEEQGKKNANEEKKRKRRKLEALLREQKEEKAKRLEFLASVRLPNNLVDNLSDENKEETFEANKRKKQKTLKKESGVHTKFPSEHYVSLNVSGAPTDFKVAVLESKKWKDRFSLPGSSDAINFRDQAINRKGIKRQTVDSIRQSQLKQDISGKGKLIGV